MMCKNWSGGCFVKEKLDLSEKINETALQMLIDYKLTEAQDIFRQNVKKNPCFITLNNLGAFYICEGIIQSNGRSRNANKLGLRYLKKAEAYKKSELNILAIANAYFKMKQYKQACKYFEQACKINKNYATLNNNGVTLYMQGEYREASEYFHMALDCCDNTHYSDIYPIKSTIYSSYAFSVLQYDKTRCLDILYQILDSNIVDIEIDEFVLAYFCNHLKLAKDICKGLLNNWNIEYSIMAMIFDCLIKQENYNEAKEYLVNAINKLKGFEYDTEKEINRINKAYFSKNYRDKAIMGYRFVPPIIEQCFYYGCKIHNHN